MLKRFFAICAIGLLSLLAACGAMPGNDQVDAGITKATVEVCQKGEAAPYFCGAEIIDGKEKASVSLDIEKPDGWKVHYAATEVKAFDGQKARAAVEQAISADLSKAFPDTVEKITKALIDVFAP